MHPQLERYHSGFLDLKTEASAVVDDIAPDTLKTRPGPKRWAAVQCFDHLNTAGWLLLRSVEKAIKRGHEKEQYGTPPFEYGVISRWFVQTMQPSSGWTFTAPSVYEPDPPNTLYPGETVDEFLELQEQFSDRVRAAEGLDLRSIRLTSPAVPLLRVSLGAWFEATLAHERRHLDQARRALDTLRSA